MILKPRFQKRLEHSTSRKLTTTTSRPFDAFVYELRGNHLVIFQVTVKIEAHNIKCKALDWLGADPVDLVVVADSKGGTDVCTPFTHSLKIRNVYRLEF